MKIDLINVKNEVKKRLQALIVKAKRVNEKIRHNVKEEKSLKLSKINLKYYVILILMLIVAAVTTYANIVSYQKENTEKYVTYRLEKDENSLSGKVTEKEDGMDKIEDNTSEENANNTNAIPVISQGYIIASSSIAYMDNNEASFQSNISKANFNNTTFEKYLSKINGSILQDFASNELVYYTDLGVWKTHKAIDIQMEEASYVYPIFSGKVIGKYNDGIYGNSIIIEGNSYIVIYSGLTESEMLNIGDNINEDEKIAKIGIVPAECSLGCHLHLEIMKDGEYVDPKSI